jgi:hypothetical protein
MQLLIQLSIGIRAARLSDRESERGLGRAKIGCVTDQPSATSST